MLNFPQSYSRCIYDIKFLPVSVIIAFFFILADFTFTTNTVKPVLSDHPKIDRRKVLKKNGSLMKVESIAECSKRAFCNTFDLHLAIIGLENQLLDFFLSGRLRQVLL